MPAMQARSRRMTGAAKAQKVGHPPWPLSATAIVATTIDRPISTPATKLPDCRRRGTRFVIIFSDWNHDRRESPPGRCADARSGFAPWANGEPERRRPPPPIGEHCALDLERQIPALHANGGFADSSSARPVTQSRSGLVALELGAAHSCNRNDIARIAAAPTCRSGCGNGAMTHRPRRTPRARLALEVYPNDSNAPSPCPPFPKLHFSSRCSPSAGARIRTLPSALSARSPSIPLTKRRRFDNVFPKANISSSSWWSAVVPIGWPQPAGRTFAAMS